MAIFDSFDGVDGTIVRTRPGWLATSGGATNQPVLNGSGAVRTLDTLASSSTGLTLHDTADLSHFAESVIGSDAIGGASGAGVLVLVKAGNEANAVASYYGVTYAVDTNTVRLVAGSTLQASAVRQLVPGDVVRLEAQMNTDNTSVTLQVFVNGVRIIGPLARSSNLNGTCVGFRAQTGRAHNPYITSFAGGSLTPSEAPFLSDPTGSATGTNSAAGSVVTSQEGGNLRFLATTSPTATAASIISSGSAISVPQAGYYAVGPVSGLTPNTTYYMHFVQESPSGNSNVVSSAAFTTEALPVTLTLSQLKNNTGTVLANQTNVTVHLYAVSTGNKVVSKTGQSSDVNGVISFTDPLLVAGTQYRAVIVLSNGAEGMVKVTAA